MKTIYTQKKEIEYTLDKRCKEGINIITTKNSWWSFVVDRHKRENKLKELIDYLNKQGEK